MKFHFEVVPLLVLVISTAYYYELEADAFTVPTPSSTRRVGHELGLGHGHGHGHGHGVKSGVKNGVHYHRKKNTFRSYSSSSSSSSSLNAVADNKSSYDEECDVLVLGSGPAARAIACLLSSPNNNNSNNNNNKLDVIIADSNYDRKWAPNYGVWEDEWQSIVTKYSNNFDRTLDGSCIDRKWDVTDCYFGGSFDIPTTERFRIDRPYYRIDKDALQRALSPPLEGGKDDVDGDAGGDGLESWYRVIKANHISKATNLNVYSPAGSLVHDESGSTILLQKSNSDQTKTTLSVRTKLIVDCTGHETKLVLREGRDGSLPPGYQIAYGALVSVDETNVLDKSQIGPYDKEAMTLFDYRTDHYDDDADTDTEIQKKVERAPTFMYAMPLSDNKIFFEETSLVARPAVSFQECKDRCYKRLEHLGIKVVDVEEEEYCYIPMGGALPAVDQRVVAFGGAAAMAHPSTGYNLARNMMAATDLAKSISENLLSSSPSSSGTVNLDKVAACAYDSIWSPSNIMQRNFAVFGGEFLMKQDVVGLRGFFDGFFRLPIELWSGFLAGWPGLPNNDKHETWDARLVYGLNFISKIPFSVALDMFLSIVGYSLRQGIPLPQSVTPIFGKPEGYTFVDRPKNQGDVAAKNEARKMIAESKVEEVIPVAFDVDVEEGETATTRTTTTTTLEEENENIVAGV